MASGGCAARDSDHTCIQPEVFLWQISDDTLVLRHQYVPPGDGSYIDRITSSEVYDLKFNPQIHCGGDLELGLAFGLAEGPVEFCYTLDNSGAVSDLLVQDWISGHLRGTTALDYGPDGDEIVAGGLGGGLRYWQGANNDPAILTGFDARVTAIAISAESGPISRVTACPQRFGGWHAAQRTGIYRFGPECQQL